MADIIIDIASEFTGAKAFKKAESATFNLTKSVKKLAATFGVAYSTAAVIAYGKASVKAAAEDQKAQKQLALALKNVGLGRDAAITETFIHKLESEFGVVDDKLRPAYQTLAIATRDTAESQKLLQLSLDISAATGKDLSAVTAALSKAYLGNNTALSKLGVGISKADLKAGKFNDIVDQLSVTFAGAATTTANTFQGSMDKLGVAAQNVSEIIGTGLIDALKGLGDQDSVDNLAKSMQDVATYTADAIRGVGIFLQQLKQIPGAGLIGDLFKVSQETSLLGFLANLGKKQRQNAELQGTSAQALAHLSELQSKYAVKTLNTTKKITKETAAQLAAKKLSQAIDKANLALGKGEDIFNLDKIQVAAALTNQAEQLGKATSAAQILAVTQDLQRLRVKQDIAALDDAIASKDEKAITAATAKLNEDLKILSVLSGQNVKLADIKTILDSLKPKDLIDLDNLNAALAALKLIMADLGTAASLPIAKIPPKVTIPTNPVTPNPNVPNPLVPNPNVQNQPPTTPPTSSPNYSNPDFIPLIPQGGLLGVSNDSINELLDATAARADALASLLDDETAAIQSALNAIAVSGLSSVLNNDRAGGSGGLGFGSPIVNVYANTIANPDELTNLIQDSIIRINRRGDLLTTAGAL